MSKAYQDSTGALPPELGQAPNTSDMSWFAFSPAGDCVGYGGRLATYLVSRFVTDQGRLTRTIVETALEKCSVGDADRLAADGFGPIEIMVLGSAPGTDVAEVIVVRRRAAQEGDVRSPDLGSEQTFLLEPQTPQEDQSVQPEYQHARQEDQNEEPESQHAQQEKRDALRQEQQVKQGGTSAALSGLEKSIRIWPFPWVELAPGGVIIDCSVKAATILGLATLGSASEESHGNPVLMRDILDRDDVQRFEKALRSVERGGAIALEEIKVPLSPWNIKIVGLGLFKPEYSPGVVIFIRDMTEETYASELLEDTAALAKMGGWKLDLETMTPRWTKETYRIHEIEPGTSVTLDQALSYYEPHEQERLSAMIADMIETGIPFDDEFDFCTAGGKKLRLRVVSKPKFKNSKVVELNGVIQDVTQLRQSERAKLAAQSMYRHLVERMRESIIVTDAEGIITFANKSAERLIGRDRFELQGTRLVSYLIETDRQAFDSFTNWARSGSYDSLEIVAPDKVFTLDSEAKTAVSVLVSELPGFEAGESQLLNILSDVTERIRVGDVMQNTARLQSLGLVAGGMAHNFRNILASILLNVEVAERRPEGIESRLASIKSLVHQGSRMSSRFQSFAQGGPTELESVDIKSVVNDTLIAALAGTNIVYRVQQSLGTGFCLADQGQMQEVFMNLFINAREAIQGAGVLNGSIGVTISRVQLGSGNEPGLDEGPYLSIQVTDNGPGIPAAVIQHVFDPFYTTKANGTGLGLPSVYFILRNHGGAITVSSVPEKGASFTVFLPALQPNAATDWINHSNHRTDKVCARILLIEDDPALQGLLQTSLEEFGHRVHVASGEHQAKKIFAEHFTDAGLIDIIITDLTLVGSKGGSEVVAELRAQRPEVPAIILSSNSQDTVFVNHIEHGFDAALLKPVPLADLIDTIQKVLSNHGQVDPKRSNS